MHLAYLDESEEKNSIAMFGAVIVPNGAFGWAERMHSIAVEQLFPVDEIEEKFQEFHASEMFNVEGSFKGIGKTKCFDAIRVLLMTMRHHQLPFIYAAIDKKKLANHKLSEGLLETADPLVPAFKMCVLGIEQWARNNHAQDHPGTVKIDYSDQYLLIADDTNNQEIKKRLKNSYRFLRAARPYIVKTQTRLWHAHDAMYFGDSKESVGIQLADLCTYFMQRHLSKRNPDSPDEAEEFYKMFSDHAICAKPEPEWSDYRELFVSHDGV